MICRDALLRTPTLGGGRAMVLCVQDAVGEDARASPHQDWTETEVRAATFADARLHRRFASLLDQLAS